MKKRILHFPTDAASSHSGTSIWLRQWLVNCILFMTMLSASAQTNWTTQHQTPGRFLANIAYGAGRYVAIGGDGGSILRTSEDGNNWVTSSSSAALYGIVYATGKFVVVGDDGTVRTSTDGLTWVPQVSGTDKFLGSISYGGGQFMAVGDEGIAITSPDGITWTTLTTGTTNDLSDVTYGGSQFVIVGEDGLIRTTPNGIIWTARNSGTSERLTSITSGKSGLLVAVGQSSAIITSPNGITWTPRSAPGSGDLLVGVACNLTTGQFVAASYHSNEVLTSLDGLTWSLTYSGTQLNLGGVQFINGQFIAVGRNGSIRSSLNGTAWKPLTIDGDIDLNGVAYGNGHYVAVGRYPIANHPAIASAAITSTDGINYTLGTTEHFSGAGEGFNDIVFGNGQFVAVGGEAIIQTSVDGKNWTIRNASQGASLNGVAYGGGQYVAVGTGLGPGSTGNFVRSTDGVTWTSGSVGMNTYYYGITYANGQFVAVGFDGVIGTSPNGTTWTARTSGTTKFLKSVAYGNGTYVAAGLGGTTLRSADGITWMNVAAFTIANINRVTFDNGQFVTASAHGEIFTSPNGTTWTKRKSAADGYELNGIGHGNGLFVAVGGGATVATSPDDGIQPPSGNFAITGVTTVNCTMLAADRRSLTFTPVFAGTNGQPVSFSVVNELLPTTNPGPYSLSLYIDNPTIILKATQTGTAGEANFSYNWLAACTGNAGNQPPVAPVIPNASGTVGQVYSQTIPPFTDPEGMPLTYSITGLPPGLLVTDGGNIVGPPSTAGIYEITITATDPGGLSASASYTLTINPAGSNPNAFAISGVTLVSCQAISATQRILSFSPQYDGLSGQAVSFSVVNELLPTTNSGPYSLNLYIDNPTIILKATQTGTAGEASFSYNWLAACGSGSGRKSAEVLPAFNVTVLGNPIEGNEATIAISGAQGQVVEVMVVDLQGKSVASHRFEQSQSVERVSLPLGDSRGVLILKANTASQSQTVKLLRQ